MRILVIAQAFPPFHTSGSLRVGKLARFLAERGHDIRVLTAAPLPYLRTLPLEIDASHVISTPSFDPFVLLAKAKRSSKPLAVAPVVSLDGPSRVSMMKRVKRWLAALIAFPEPQIGWYPSAVAAGLRLFRTWQPDAIYASALPFTAHLIAARLARAARVPWVAEFRDHFAGNPYSNLPSWRGPIDLWLEKRVLRTASASVTVSEPMAETLRIRHGKSVVTVLNGFDARDFASILKPAAPSTKALRIVYTGIIYPGRRDPSALFAAIAALGPEGAQIEVDFFGQDLRGVSELAQRYGVGAQVRLRGAVSYRDALAEQVAADILLLLSWNDPRELGIYTGKLFEYSGAGRPILAIGPANGVAAELIRSRGLGAVATDADEVVIALRKWLEEKVATGTVAGPASQVREGLSRDEQFAAVDRLLVSLREERGLDT